MCSAKLILRVPEEWRAGRWFSFADMLLEVYKKETSAMLVVPKRIEMIRDKGYRPLNLVSLVVGDCMPWGIAEELSGNSLDQTPPLVLEVSRKAKERLYGSIIVVCSVANRGWVQITEVIGKNFELREELELIFFFLHLIEEW